MDGLRAGAREVLRHYHILATLRESGGEASHRVIEPASGEVRLCRRLLCESVWERSLLGRMVREVQCAMRVEEPVLARYRDVDRAQDGLLVFRDWIEAPSLREDGRFGPRQDPLRRTGRAGPEDYRELAVAILEALVRLHERGFAALRLHPGNVFVLGPGRVALSDWGLASWRGARPAGHEGVSADLLGLGRTLFEVATGRVPGADPGPGAEELECMGPRLGPLLARLLSPDPLRRPGSCRQALWELDPGRLVPRRSGVPGQARLPLLGRDSEVEQLRAALGDAARGRGRLSFVRGPSGIGKTRLLEVAASLAASHGLGILRAGAPEPPGYPFGCFGSVFADLAREMAGWPASAQQQALRPDGRVLLEITPAFHEVPAIRDLAEPPLLPPEAARRRLLRVAARLLGVCARRRPRLLLFDDLEAADPLSVELLKHLARLLGGADRDREPGGLALVVLAAYDDGAGTAARGVVVSLRAKGLATEMVPKGLAPHELRDLLLEVLGVRELPAAFVARVMEESGGRPLDITEAIAWLAAAGVLDREPGGWMQEWDRALAELRSRDSAEAVDPALSLLLRGVEGKDRVGNDSPVGRRLERLAPETRQLLDLVAVAGNGASVDLVLTASGLERGIGERVLVSALEEHVLREEASGGLMFRHARLKVRILEELVQARRHALHLRIARAIEQRGGPWDDRSVLLLAQHFDLAGEVEQAMSYLPLAARILKERHAPEAALRLYRSFFDYLGRLSPTEQRGLLGKRLQAQRCLAETLVLLGRRPEASSTYREMAAVAEDTGREDDLVSAWSGLATLSLAAGSLDAAESFARRAVDLARQARLGSALADNLCVLGSAAAQRHRHEQATAYLSAALRTYEEQDDALGLARAHLALGDVEASRHDVERALASYHGALERFAEVDDKVGISAAHNRLGRVELERGDASRAVQCHRQALALEREADDREGMGRTLDDLGTALLEQGDLRLAGGALEEALAIKRELADVRGSADSLVRLATASLRQDRIEEALGLLNQALTLARRTGNLAAELGGLEALAEAKLRSGEREAAAELADTAAYRARSAGERRVEARVLLILSRARPHREARESAEQAREAARASGVVELELETELRLAAILALEGETEQAAQAYRAVLNRVEELRSGRSGSLVLRKPGLAQGLREAVDFLVARSGEAPVSSAAGERGEA